MNWRYPFEEAKFAAKWFLNRGALIMRVPVLDSRKRPLMPCTPKRARCLLNQGKASVYSTRFYDR